MADGVPRLEFDSASGLFDPTEMGLRALKGREALSEPYELELELAVDVDGGLSDEALEIIHVAIHHAGGAASQHEKSCDLIGLAFLVHLEQLPDTNRQRQTFATGRVLQPKVQSSTVR